METPRLCPSTIVGHIERANAFTVPSLSSANTGALRRIALPEGEFVEVAASEQLFGALHESTRLPLAPRRRIDARYERVTCHDCGKFAYALQTAHPRPQLARDGVWVLLADDKVAVLKMNGTAFYFLDVNMNMITDYPLQIGRIAAAVQPTPPPQQRSQSELPGKAHTNTLCATNGGEKRASSASPQPAGSAKKMRLEYLVSSHQVHTDSGERQTPAPTQGDLTPPDSRKRCPQDKIGSPTHRSSEAVGSVISASPEPGFAPLCILTTVDGIGDGLDVLDGMSSSEVFHMLLEYQRNARAGIRLGVRLEDDTVVRFKLQDTAGVMLGDGPAKQVAWMRWLENIKVARQYTEDVLILEVFCP